jgi:hypothetical protein
MTALLVVDPDNDFISEGRQDFPLIGGSKRRRVVFFFNHAATRACGNCSTVNSGDDQTWVTLVSGQTRSHQLHELLAWNWKAARKRAARGAA